MKIENKDISDLTLEELRLLKKDLEASHHKVVSLINTLVDKCKHLTVIIDEETDPHKGKSQELKCKCCNRSMYYHMNNYYPYPISAPRDDIERFMEESE